MKYAYEDLGDTRFEELVVTLCRRLLGMAAQGFAKGPDGGRDAKFVGTAELLPSTRAPWSGTVIVQAKHTYGFNRSFSETDFFNPKSMNNILGEEVPRIKKLRLAMQLDHYMLFANRKLTGGAESASPLPILDLIVILTFWSSVDLRFLRVARMVRLLKVLNLAHFEESLQRVGAALSRRKELLIVAMVMMVLCIYASAAILYQVEHSSQPNVFSSIPGTLWWAMTTLTTIGYGDMVPITPFGKLCAGLISVFGIGVFALPTAIVTAAIVEAGASDNTPVLCRHCGKDAKAPLAEIHL